MLEVIRAPVRLLRRNLGLSAFAIAILGLGIGAATAGLTGMALSPFDLRSSVSPFLRFSVSIRYLRPPPFPRRAMREL